MELLEQYPAYVKESIPILLTNRSALTKRMQLYITSDSTTGKSFEEVGNLISVFRTSNYMSKKVIYLSAMKEYIKHSKSTLDSYTGTSNDTSITANKIEDFSTFNSCNGYGSKLQPTNQFITTIFKEYCYSNRTLIESWQENNVLSLQQYSNRLEYLKFICVYDIICSS